MPTSKGGGITKFYVLLFQHCQTQNIPKLLK